MTYCSNCGRQLQPDAVFCSKCGATVGSTSPAPGERQQLARAVMNAQVVQLFAYAGGIIGAIVGFVAPAMLLGDSLGTTDPALWFLLCFGLGFVGLFVGSRVALTLMAR